MEHWVLCYSRESSEIGRDRCLTPALGLGGPSALSRVLGAMLFFRRKGNEREVRVLGRGASSPRRLGLLDDFRKIK